MEILKNVYFVFSNEVEEILEKAENVISIEDEEERIKSGSEMASSILIDNDIPIMIKGIFCRGFMPALLEKTREDRIKQFVSMVLEHTGEYIFDKENEETIKKHIESFWKERIVFTTENKIYIGSLEDENENSKGIRNEIDKYFT